MAQEPQERRVQESPGQRNMPTQRGSARGTATMGREYQARETRPPVEHRPKKNHLPLKIAGLLGILALAGLIAGLVVSHNPPSTPAHVAAPPVARQLSTFGSTQPGTSPPFGVPSSPVKSTYGYSCPAGTSGRFIASLVSANGADSQTIANTSGPSGSGAATLHPHQVGSNYHVRVTSPAGCGYRVNTGIP